MQQGTKRLRQSFWVLFTASFGVIWLGAVRHWSHNGWAALGAALVLGAGALGLLCGLYRRLTALSPAAARRWLAAGLLLHGLLLAAAGLLLAQVPIMDLEVVWQSLPDFLDSPFLEAYNIYYLECNNNLGIALLLAGLFRLLAPLGIRPATPERMTAAILFNCLALWLTTALVCRAAWRLTRSLGGALTALALCLVYLPFYLWSPVFYSDTLAMPFLMGALAVCLRYQDTAKPRTRLALAAAMGALVFGGFAVKGSLAVLLVALPLHLVLERTGGLKSALAGAAALLLTFGLLLGGYRLVQRQVLLDYTEYDRWGLPIELWFAYGSHGTGDYSREDYEACMELPTVELRQQMLRQRIRQNYASRGLGEQARFFHAKAVRTWGEGLFNAEEFTRTPLRGNWTAFFTVPGQPGFMPLVYLCQALHLLVLGLTVVSGLRALLQRDDPGGLFPAQLALFGVMLFLSLWETKARYALHFAPVLLLCAVTTLWGLAAEKGKIKEFSAK